MGRQTPQHILSRARKEQRGFTLIELLAVMVIIGILAAIALPSFLSQSDKGHDADAKSNARNLVSQLESCFAAEEDYTHCDTAAELAPLSLNYGSGVGQVEVTASAQRSYEITAHSKADGGGAHMFIIVKDLTGSSTRTCTPTGQGGCPADGTW